jgi:hypothetical protein
MLKALGGFAATITGAVVYEGTWDAATNTPTLTSSVGTAGEYYVVNVAGSTNLDGITDWDLGDWAIFNGIVWQKVDNSEPDPLIVNSLTANNVSISSSLTVDTVSISSALTVDTVSILNSLSANLASSNTAAMPDPSLPLNPEGYIDVVINGTTKKIPYYGV